MPSKYPVLKPKEVIAVLSTFGFTFVSQKGSHRKYTDGKHVWKACGYHTHARRGCEEVAKGTLRSILRMAEITIDEFMEAMEAM